MDVVRQVMEVVFTATLMPLQLLVVPPTIRTLSAPRVTSRPLTFLVGRAAEDARNAHKRYLWYYWTVLNNNHIMNRLDLHTKSTEL